MNNRVRRRERRLAGFSSRRRRLMLEQLEDRRLLTDVSAAPILQWFEASYETMEDRMADVFLAGYGALWTPPTSRGDTGDNTVGYDVYDRFDLGEPGRPTLYGTETGIMVLADSMHRAGVDLHVDFVMNHNGYSTSDTEGFVDAGGYPGLAIKLDNDIDGDFHSVFWGGAEYERLAGLIDIAQEKDHLFIRNPVDPFDSLNIPAGTTPAFGRLANIPDPANQRFYPDIGHNTIYVYDPVTEESDIPVHQFNLEDPMAGDAVPENAMGYLMRNAQWLVQVVGVDGLRIDAAKHMQGFVLDYLDRAIYRQNPRSLLDGSTKHVFTYSEVYDANPAVLHPHVKKTIDPLDPGTIGGNRDTLDFKLYFALKENLEYGTQPGWTNWDTNRYAWYQIKDAALDTSPHEGQGDTLHNGNAGVTFVQSHDVHKPFQLDNVAHAYTLMMPGNTVVYFNGKEFGDERDFPKDGRGDALSVAVGSDLTRIVSARNTHGRGDYAERWVDDQGLYAFERGSSSLVLLSNRTDSGFDSRTLEHVGFAPGTYLVELTGNATDAARDPMDDISEVIQVFDDGGVSKVNVRFPRNTNATGDWTGSGYVIYGLPTPQAPDGLELLNVNSVMAGDGSPTNDYENGVQRQSDIHVVTGDALNVRLKTVEVNLLGSLRDEWADGDNALLKLDGGRAINTLNPNSAASGVDFVQPGSVTYGFERFEQKSSPLVGPGGLGDANWEGDGEFLQTIDLTGLEEGTHFLEARAFRHRTDGGPAVFSSFKKVFYVDRLAPESGVDSFLPWDSGVQENRDLVVRSLDKTADNVHVFLNLPAGTSDSEIMTMVGNGEGTASRYDRDLFKYGFLDVPHGNNVATIVSFEQTGNSNIQRVPGLFTSTIIGAGLGDLDHDGDYDLDDVNRFGAIYRSGEAEFDAAGDFTADGLTTYADLLAMIARLKEVEADVVTVAAAEDLQAEFFGAVDDAFSTDEDSVLVVDPPGILGNDLDPGMEGSLNLETTGEVETALGGTATFDANGRLHYVPPESLQALSSGTSIKDSGSYTVNDGLGTTSTATVEITVNGVNNAPVVVNKEISFPNIAEDNMDPPGKPVSWILDNLGYSDADDNAERGIAITTFDYDALGRLQKSTDSGTSWQDAPDVPEGKALLLADSAMVRVVPNGEYGGSGEIEFYGWDQTYDASGRVVQLTDRGGRNAFSIASGTVDFSIQDVNNVPTLDAIADPAAIDEDAAQQTVDLAGITSGAANEDQPLIITATSSNPSLIKDPTVVYTSKDPTGTLKYTPEANQSGITTITVTVEDGGLDKDLATTEDNATFSRTFDVTVTTVNDTPEVTDGVFEPTENVLFVRDAASGISTLVNDADGDELTFTLVDSTRHGELVLAADGSFSYMPDANFNRTDSFTFKVNDGTVDSEVVTVTLNMQTNFPWHNGALWGDVNNDGRVNVADAMGVVQIVLGSEHAALPADEGLRPIQAPFYDMNRDGEITAEDFEVLKDHINLTQSPVGRVRVLPTDEGGELLRQVQVGENFWLSMLLMDIRLDAKGVFASYVRVHYDKDTVQVTGDPLFVSPYENGPHFDRSSAGLVNEVGATASLSELGADEYLQFRLPMKALAEGLGSFTLSPAQDSPDHDFLVYGWDYPVATRQVNLGTSTLLIHPSSGGEGEAPLELYAFTAPSPRPLLAQPARRSLFDWVAREPGDVARYREAVDDAMRTVVKQPAPVLYRSAVQRIDGLEHGEEEADLLDEILVDEVFSGAGLPGE